MNPEGCAVKCDWRSASYGSEYVVSPRVHILQLSQAAPSFHIANNISAILKPKTTMIYNVKTGSNQKKLENMNHMGSTTKINVSVSATDQRGLHYGRRYTCHSSVSARRPPSSSDCDVLCCTMALNPCISLRMTIKHTHPRAHTVNAVGNSCATFANKSEKALGETQTLARLP